MKLLKEIRKMPESQIIEYKQSWHDDCLKWVCGFSNAYVEIPSERFRIEFGKDSETKWHPKPGG